MENFLTPAFFVDETVEVKSVPTTGEEFLRKVMAERHECPELVTVEPSHRKRQNYFIVEPPATETAPPTLNPTIEWQNVQLCDFYSMRILVIRLYLENKKVHNAQLPNINEATTPSLGKKFITTNRPGLQLMLALKQKDLDFYLEIILDMLDEVPAGHGIDEPIGEWIYSILIRQNNPVLSDTICLLRNLARRCAQIRSQLCVDDERSIELATPLNLFICIVAKYFRQLDLAD